MDPDSDGDPEPIFFCPDVAVSEYGPSHRFSHGVRTSLPFAPDQGPNGAWIAHGHPDTGPRIDIDRADLIRYIKIAL